MLAEDGHEVTVLEPDPADPPGTSHEAWDGWRRAGVARFRQPHTPPRFRQVVDQELPGLTERLADGGCVRVDHLESLPPSIENRAPRPGDDRFRFVTGRRPVTEAVVAAAAEEHPRLSVRRGVRVAGLVPGPSALPGVPHVAGVRTGSGEESPPTWSSTRRDAGRRARTGWPSWMPAQPGRRARPAASSATPAASPAPSSRGGSARSWRPWAASR